MDHPEAAVYDLDRTFDFAESLCTFLLGFLPDSGDDHEWLEINDPAPAAPVFGDPKFGEQKPHTAADPAFFLPSVRITVQPYEETTSCCDYGEGRCQFTSTEGFLPAAVCGVCQSHYHVACMQQRSHLAPPALPLDGESIFWSVKCKTILCPSCVRDRDFQKYPYTIISYEDAFRNAFAASRKKATLFSKVE